MKFLYHLDKFKELRRLAKTEIRKEYLNFVSHSETIMKDDPKKFWSFVNMKKKRSSVPGHMIHEGKTLTSPEDIVNAFAQQFETVFVCDSANHVCDITCDIGFGVCDYCDKLCCPSLVNEYSCLHSTVLNNFCIHPDQILKAAKKLKNNCVAGPDDVPAFIIKDSISCLLVPLCHIFNLILETGSYPTIWKSSRLCPVHKSGDRNKIDNYRPIALLCNFAKLFESVLSDIMYSHVRNGIIVEQHGFLKGKSTTTNLYEFTHFVSQALDKRSQVDVVYTDLSKAFDKVNHCILLRKLDAFGISGNLIKVIKSMLLDRQQYVEYSGYKSKLFSVHSGVAQGSNLGPLLFIMFLNDVVNYIDCKFYIYADDLKIVNIIKDLSDCEKLQQNIDKFTSYCKNNHLPINNGKCLIMSYTRKVVTLVFDYNINGTMLKRSDRVSDLGVIMDCTLSFIPHFEAIVTNAMKILGFIIRNTIDFNDISIIRSLFHSLVRCKLEYCAVIWNPFQHIYVMLFENVLSMCKMLN